MSESWVSVWAQVLISHFGRKHHEGMGEDSGEDFEPQLEPQSTPQLTRKTKSPVLKRRELAHEFRLHVRPLAQCKTI